MTVHRLSAADVKTAARGRWAEILTVVAGIDATLLDGRHHPCPKCGGTDRFSLIDTDAGAVLCRACFATKNGDGLAAVGWARNCGFRAALEAVAEFLGVCPVPNGKPSAKTAANGKPAPEVERADAETRDRAYRLLLAELSLSAAQRAALRERGLSDEASDAGEFRSYPGPRERTLLKLKLFYALGDRVFRTVPGCVASPLSLAGASGLLIPVREAEGRVVALKVRADKARDEDSRYTYLSSASKGGPKADAAAHVPAGITGPCPLVRVTEGEIKADVASRLSGVATVSIPGVGNWRPALAVLKSLSTETVRVAFDADARTKPEVARHLHDFVEALATQGYAIELERWPLDIGKGIDDVLAAGRGDAIELLTGEDALAAAREIAAAAGVQERPAPTAAAGPLLPPSATVALDGAGEFDLVVYHAAGRARRQVVAIIGAFQYVDKFDVMSASARAKFWKVVAHKVCVDPETIESAAAGKLFELAEAADKQSGQAGGEEEEEECKTDAQRAVELADEWLLWRTPAREGYATASIGGHGETWATKSSGLRSLLAKAFYEEYERPINGESLTTAINLLDARAKFGDDEHPAFVRIGERNGAVYLDLCNDDWQVIEITAEGWQAIDESPVHFRRSKGMLALPTPERGGSIDELRPFLNVSDETWPLVVAWLLGAFSPTGPYSVLTLAALQGSGKSTAGKMLRALVDPAQPALRSQPREERDLLIAATNAWLLAFDNLSSIPVWLSDALCRVNSGGGFATRELYTNDEEAIFDAARPVLLTSIEDVATRSDLLDRALVVNLEPLADDKRLAERELWARFELARPRILGALSDAIAVALRHLPTTSVDRPSRMLDFLQWVTAAEPALGWPAGRFLDAYEANRGDANALAVEASPIAKSLLQFLDSLPAGEWVGSAGELLAELDQRMGNNRPPKGWPESPRGLSGAVKRLAPNLKAAGWDVSTDRDTTARRKRLLAFRKGTQTTVRTVQTGQPTLADTQAPDGLDELDGCQRPFSAPSENKSAMEEGDA